MYGTFGDRIIDTYSAAKRAGGTSPGIQRAMEAKIVEIGPSNVSAHMADPARLNVVDIDPGSISHPIAFEAAIRADKRVSKFLKPPADPAYHLEIPQPPDQTLSQYPLKKLSEPDLNKIMLLAQAQLSKVEEHTGVPWQAIAALWYRESFAFSTKEPSGPFGFTVEERTPTALRLLLDRFTDLDATEKELLVSMASVFEAACYFAACRLRLKTAPVITPHATDEQIKDALWGYSGRYSAAAYQSSYVMNGFDENHLNMITIRPGVEPAVDSKLGAFSVFKLLKQQFP